MTMRIVNRSDKQDDTLQQMIGAAVDAYHSVFAQPSCEVEIIVCRDPDDLGDLAEKHTGSRDEFREYAGNFLCPKKKGDFFRILVCVKDDAVVGASHYFEERRSGSLRDADLPQETRERRGIELGNYCQFVEMLQHEYSHLCSFEKLMEATDWADPAIGAHSMDYHLYDEMIARYRGTYAMLRMMEPFMERDLIYTMWMHLWQVEVDAFKDESGKMRNQIAHFREEIERGLLADMRSTGMSGKDAVREMEYELGHPLANGGKLTEMGVPQLSDVEVVEFFMFDDFTDDEAEIAGTVLRRGLPMLYFAHNSYASYQGAQLVGLVNSFYDFLSVREPRVLELTGLMGEPYYETIDVEALNRKLNEFADLFMKRR